MTTIYKSDEGARAVRERYLEILKRWPVPNEQMRVPTRQNGDALAALSWLSLQFRYVDGRCPSLGRALSRLLDRPDWRSRIERAHTAAARVRGICVVAR